MTKPRILFILPILLILIVTSFMAGHRALRGSNDFDTYYYAGKAVLDDLPLYTIAQHSVNLSDSPFVYPPFFAFLITPLSILPIYTAAVLWNLISFCSFLGAIFLIGQILDIKKNVKPQHRKENFLWILLATALLLAVLIDNLAMAQVNCFVFFLVALGLYHLRKSRDFLSGFLIGIATCIKLFPAIFFPYFLIRRKWKALLGAAAAIILCIGLVPAIASGIPKSIELHRQWFEETIRPHTMPQTLAFYSNQLNPSHQDLKAVVFRWVIDWHHRETTGGPHGREFFFRTPIRMSQSQAAQAGNVALGLIALFFISLIVNAGRKPDQSTFLCTVSLILTTMVLVSPKARSHFFVFLAFPWLVLIDQIMACGKSKLREKQVLLVSAFFYFAQGVKYFKFLGFGAFSALALWIYFAVKLNKLSKEKA